METRVQPSPAASADFSGQPQENLGRYHSYLLRVWSDTENAPWHFTLEAVDSGERVAFHSLEELFAFLDRKTTLPPPAQTPTLISPEIP